jgi:uncharacterized protein YidB (DUF937 family)
LGDIGTNLKLPTIVEAQNRPIANRRQHPGNYGISLQLPIITNCGPHHSQKLESALGGAETEPADAEGGAQEAWGETGDLLNGLLSTRKVLQNKGRGVKAEEWMGMAVIADFVAGSADGAGNLGETLDARAALKESGWYIVACEEF